MRDFEPGIALVAGADGLDVIRRIAAQAPGFLVPGGRLLMEIGYDQKERVDSILSGAGFTSVRFFNDYSQIPRVAAAQREPGP